MMSMVVCSRLSVSRIGQYIPRLSLCTSCIRQQKTSTSVKAIKKNRNDFNEMGYVLLIIPAAALCLGTWQVKRRKWKLDLIAELEEKSLAEPIPIPSNLEQIEDLEYKRIKVRGSFDHNQELYIHPRHLSEPDSNTHGGLISMGKTPSGYHVITAFKLADRDLRILVNRGWVARNRLNPATRPEGQIQEEVEIVGVVRKSEKRPPFGAKNDPARNQWHFRDQEGMAQVLNTMPILLDADRSTTIQGGPVGGQTRLSLRNEHLSYIVTWYSLAVITSGMWYSRFWKVR